MKHIEVKPGYAVLKPTYLKASGLTEEHKKYERKSTAEVVTIELSDIDCEIIRLNPKAGDIVVYDDSHSVNLPLDGQDYELVNINDILALIKEDN